jgi:tRNA-dihydrouridine synthase
MISKAPVFTFLLLFVSFVSNAQFMRYTQERALDSLSKLKPLFQKTDNDSAFISKYSESSYSIYFFTRGDHAEDIDDQIYTASPGDVIGPFRGYDSSNFLFKILSFEEYKLRSKASLIYIRPNAENKQDAASIRKFALKYSDALKKGKNIKELAEKDNVRLIYKDLGWYYEGMPEDKEYFDLVMKAEKGDAYIIESNSGASILTVTVSKEKVPVSVKLIGIMKKG